MEDRRERGVKGWEVGKERNGSERMGGGEEGDGS